MSKKVVPVRESLNYTKQCPKCNNFSVTYDIEKYPNKQQISEIDKKLKSKKIKLTDEERAGLEIHKSNLKKYIIPLKPAYSNHREVLLREHIRVTHLTKDIVTKAEDLEKLELKYQQDIINRDTHIQELQAKLDDAPESLYIAVLGRIENEYKQQLNENLSEEDNAALLARLKLVEAENKKLKDAKEEK